MNQIESIQALSLQDKENEGMRKMEEIKMAVCSAMGVFAYDPTNRKRQNVIVRVITANVLLRIGCTENYVGKIMKKNHSTIHHYKVTMNTWLEFPGVYKQELNIWNQIKQAYETD